VNFFGARRHPGATPLSSEGRLPGFDGATGWLNSPPLTADDLRGKVVLVDFWTYTCINWLRTLAYVRAWYEAYRELGLLIVGVHTPEFWFEHDVDNVGWAANEMRVEYPVAIDRDYGVWRDFGNRYWPAVYIADAQGRIRYHHFGEGDYDECERAIQMLLREAGVDGVGDDLVAVSPEGFEAQADWTNLRSPETYLGYEQGRGFASPDGAELDEPHTYVLPESLQLNQWALAGERTIATLLVFWLACLPRSSPMGFVQAKRWALLVERRRSAGRLGHHDADRAMDQRSSPATRLTNPPMITTPNRYASRAWASTARRMRGARSVVSDTW
jgi:hypothetical protein